LLNGYQLKSFEQFATGDGIYETRDGRVLRSKDAASMANSYRVQDGVGMLVTRMEQSVQPNALQLQATVTKIAKAEAGYVVHYSTPETLTQELSTTAVVYALPPRIVAQRIEHIPPLPHVLATDLAKIPTWMASYAKFIAVYPTPFWRENGLSGDASSERGPLGEVHDASQPGHEASGVLFGFVSIDPDRRRTSAQRDQLTTEALAQLERMFGSAAAQPLSVHLEDWASQPETATELDQSTLRYHPRYGSTEAMKAQQQQHMFFAGTEAASNNGGFMEGALAQAEVVYEQLCAEFGWA
jgi:monoamine oxidase